LQVRVLTAWLREAHTEILHDINAFFISRAEDGIEALASSYERAQLIVGESCISENVQVPALLHTQSLCLTTWDNHVHSAAYRIYRHSELTWSTWLENKHHSLILSNQPPLNLDAKMCGTRCSHTIAMATIIFHVNHHKRYTKRRSFRASQSAFVLTACFAEHPSTP
jgi:hypothetical protein